MSSIGPHAIVGVHGLPMVVHGYASRAELHDIIIVPTHGHGPEHSRAQQPLRVEAEPGEVQGHMPAT